MTKCTRGSKVLFEILVTVFCYFYLFISIIWKTIGKFKKCPHLSIYYHFLSITSYNCDALSTSCGQNCVHRQKKKLLYNQYIPCFTWSLILSNVFFIYLFILHLKYYILDVEICVLYFLTLFY